MSIQAIIDGKFLSLCPPSEAVAWLKGKREATRDVRFAQENKHEEETLAARNDPYVDFGLANTAGAPKPVEKFTNAGIMRSDARFSHTFRMGASTKSLPTGSFWRTSRPRELKNCKPS